jgi:hypothetical protein
MAFFYQPSTQPPDFFGGGGGDDGDGATCDFGGAGRVLVGSFFSAPSFACTGPRVVGVLLSGIYLAPGLFGGGDDGTTCAFGGAGRALVGGGFKFFFSVPSLMTTRLSLRGSVIAGP